MKEYVSFLFGKIDKSNLISNNASRTKDFCFESLTKADFLIVKQLFLQDHSLEKYRYPVSNVAMVCVAAVALGSSTYAWFVSNNKVTATTSTISAQSNAAFMYICDKDEESKDLTFDTSSIDSTALYPAHQVTAASDNYANAEVGKFYRAYGKLLCKDHRNH